MIDFQNASYFKLSKTNPGKVEKTLAPLLLPDETILSAYSSIRDFIVFTDKRILCCNVQGITGKKKDFTSIPYAKISTFSVETSGVLDLDSELEIYLSGVGKVKFEFLGTTDITEIARHIALYALK